MNDVNKTEISRRDTTSDTPTEALSLAIKFHDTYERLAPSFGYETRTETRLFDPTTPNGQLMVAVCDYIGEDLRRELREETKQKLLDEICALKLLKSPSHIEVEAERDDLRAKLAQAEAELRALKERPTIENVMAAQRAQQQWHEVKVSGPSAIASEQEGK